MTNTKTAVYSSVFALMLALLLLASMRISARAEVTAPQVPTESQYSCSSEKSWPGDFLYAYSTYTLTITCQRLVGFLTTQTFTATVEPGRGAVISANVFNGSGAEEFSCIQTIGRSNVKCTGNTWANKLIFKYVFWAVGEHGAVTESWVEAHAHSFNDIDRFEQHYATRVTTPAAVAKVYMPTAISH